jgi:hypothetical protein
MSNLGRLLGLPYDLGCRGAPWRGSLMGPETAEQLRVGNRPRNDDGLSASGSQSLEPGCPTGMKGVR